MPPPTGGGGADRFPPGGIGLGPFPIGGGGGGSELLGGFPIGGPCDAGGGGGGAACCGGGGGTPGANVPFVTAADGGLFVSGGFTLKYSCNCNNVHTILTPEYTVLFFKIYTEVQKGRCINAQCGGYACVNNI